MAENHKTIKTKKEKKEKKEKCLDDRILLYLIKQLNNI